jgi:hypothetical protein
MKHFVWNALERLLKDRAGSFAYSGTRTSYQHGFYFSGKENSIKQNRPDHLTKMSAAGPVLRIGLLNRDIGHAINTLLLPGSQRLTRIRCARDVIEILNDLL